jgi:DNA-binding PadR family transcriptional regulator
MAKYQDREIEFMRVGHLSIYILNLIDTLPKVDMEPYYALIVQEVERKSGLAAGKSLVYSRLKNLLENNYVSSELGASSNPRAKKPVQFYRLTKTGKKLLANLREEHHRLAKLI